MMRIRCKSRCGTVSRSFHELGRAPYRAILEVCQEGIICLDDQSRVLVCNPSAERIFMMSRPLLSSLSPVDPSFQATDEEGCPIPPEAHPSQVVLRTGRPCLNSVQGVKNPQGRTVWINVNAQPLPPQTPGGPAGVVVSISDITQAKELESRLRTEAYRDVLTGAYNRRYFQEVLRRATGAAERFGHPMSLAMCDLDRFKQINDTFGHGSGDRALQAFSEAIHWDLRRDDLAARLGGDEFCLLFMHVGARSAAVFLERLCARIAELQVPSEDGRLMGLSASFGIVDFSPGDTPERLMEKADQALYCAKVEGGQRVHVLA